MTRKTSPSLVPLARLAARATRALCALAMSLAFAACGEAPVEPQPTARGAAELVLQAPLGEVEAYDVFVWDYSLPSGGHFEVAVYDYTSGQALGPLRRSGSLELPQWAPRAGVAERWPAQILWRAFAYDREGALLASAEAGASRR